SHHHRYGVELALSISDQRAWSAADRHHLDEKTIDHSQLKKERTLMANNPNELTIDNSLVMLIDHQPMVGFSVHSIDPGLMINNVAALARASRELGVPSVLTTIGAKGSILAAPILKEIAAMFPDVTPIDRTSTHAWSHPEVRGAVDKTKRKKLI